MNVPGSLQAGDAGAGRGFVAQKSVEVQGDAVCLKGAFFLTDQDLGEPQSRLGPRRLTQARQGQAPDPLPAPLIRLGRAELVQQRQSRPGVACSCLGERDEPQRLAQHEFTTRTAGEAQGNMGLPQGAFGAVEAGGFKAEEHQTSHAGTRQKETVPLPLEFTL